MPNARSRAMAAALFLCPAVAPAVAQDEPPAVQQVRPGAAGCLGDLGVLADRMRADGYWLSGWNRRMGPGGGLSNGGMAPTPTTTATGAPGRDESGQPVALGRPMGPWGDMGWTRPPGRDLRSLFNAAVVLAETGDEAACAEVAAAASRLYGRLADDLAGVDFDAGAVSTWRREQLTASTPVSEIGDEILVGDIVGSNLRNSDDADLGEIEDLVLDPRTGRLDYVVVSRGGFLGLGEEQVAVPWQALRATPDFASFVLPVSEEAMDGAPALSDVDATGAVTPVDDYWTEAIRTSRPVVND